MLATLDRKWGSGMRRLGLVALTTLTLGGALVGVTQPATAAGANDPVVYWNNVLLDTYRLGGAPGPLARGGAMMHAAIYDAVNSITTVGQPYVYQTSAPGASTKHAIAHAAHDTLASVFPSVDFSDELTGALTGAGPDTGNGSAVGKAAAAAMISARTGDGSTDTTPYVPGTEPGHWRPTGSGNAVTPNWGRVKPFTATSAAQFRAPLPGGSTTMPQLLASAEYAAQVNEVKELGGATSATRTPEQTDIAFFWANDLDGTYKPHGQLYAHSQIVAGDKGLNTPEKARLFAKVGLALADAAIISWDSKYQTAIDLWRPETAIQLADTDGNAAISPDPAWRPLSKNRAEVPFSPAFPAYTAGHAVFGGAWAGAMRGFFGTDAIAFTATTEDPHAVGVTRTFTSFTAAAEENARSRVYLGVHYRFDGDLGLSSAKALTDHSNARFIRLANPVPDPAVVSCSFGDLHRTYVNGELRDYQASPSRDTALRAHFGSSDGKAWYVTVDSGFLKGRKGWIASGCVRFTA